MKRATILIIAASLFLVTAVQAGIDDGLVAYYPFDGNANDFSRSGNDGTEYNGVSYAPGVKGQAASFDGIDDYIKASSNGLPTGERTVSLWFYADTISMPRPVLLGYGGGDSCGTSWFMTLAPDPEPPFYLSGHCHSFDLYGPNPQLPIGAWYHLAITTNTDGTTFYVNGKEVSHSPFFINNTAVIDGRDLAIGVDVFADGYAPYTDINVGWFDGMIDEVRIYDRALSAEEISYLTGFRITSSPRLAVQLNEFSSRQFQAEGGIAPYSWSVIDGTPPPGMNFGTDGVLSGTPPELGESTFTVGVTDSTGAVAEKVFTVEVVLVLPPQDIRINKVGTTPVPGRTLDYFIIVENAGTSSSGDIDVLELLEPWFTIVAANPPPTTITQGPDMFFPANPVPNTYDQFLHWKLPPLLPGEARLIYYQAILDPQFPIGETVTGLVCQGIPTEECEGDYASCLITLGGPACTVGLTFGPKPCVAAIAICSVWYLQCKAGLDFECFPDAEAATLPIDPNEKLVVANSRRLEDGTILSYIQPDQLLTYPIHFENIGDVEAVDVFVTDVLDPNLDDSTLELLTPDGAAYDPATRTLRWELVDRNLEPGETGNVLLSIKPVAGLPSGTEIPNVAEIQFEIFNPLVTPEVVNIIDTTKPECVVDALPAVTPTEVFTVSWTGTDNVGEIEAYAVFVSKDGAGFAPLLGETEERSVQFTGEEGSTYEFLCAARDTAGNTEEDSLVTEATTTVTVVTNVPPVAQCKAVTALADAQCLGTASVNDGSYDPDGGSVTLSQSPSGPYGLGATVVSLTVTDETGDSASCSAVVTVEDATAPGMICPGAIVAECTGSNGVPVAYDATAVDQCDADVSAICNPASGATFPLGAASPVECSATDPSGNTAQCGFTVSVRDTTAPTLVAPPAVTSQCAAPDGTPVALGEPTVNDLCDGSPTIGNDAPALFPLGTTIVTWSATDASGNKIQATQEVVVESGAACGTSGRICSLLGNDPKPSLLDQDIFEFQGTAGDPITITLEKDASGTTSGDRASLIIKQKGKLSLLGLDKGDLPNQVSVTLPKAGIYQVIVGEQPKILRGTPFRGDYCLTLDAPQGAVETFTPTAWVE